MSSLTLACCTNVGKFATFVVAVNGGNTWSFELGKLDLRASSWTLISRRRLRRRRAQRSGRKWCPLGLPKVACRLVVALVVHFGLVWTSKLNGCEPPMWLPWWRARSLAFTGRPLGLATWWKQVRYFCVCVCATASLTSRQI